MFHHAMREEYLKPTPLKPYMTYADHLVWPIHVPGRCEPLITPHLSLRGNSRTRATFPTHKKSHNPHPPGRGGRGSIWVHYIAGGWGGCLPNLDHIYIIYTVSFFLSPQNVDPVKQKLQSSVFCVFKKFLLSNFPPPKKKDPTIFGLWKIYFPVFKAKSVAPWVGTESTSRPLWSTHCLRARPLHPMEFCFVTWWRCI